MYLPGMHNKPAHVSQDKLMGLVAGLLLAASMHGDCTVQAEKTLAITSLDWHRIALSGKKVLRLDEISV